jgi:hypothetical protein
VIDNRYHQGAEGAEDTERQLGATSFLVEVLTPPVSRSPGVRLWTNAVIESVAIGAERVKQRDTGAREKGRPANSG